MKFVYPQFLWAFTVLLLPIIIHLFHFKRYKTLYFSSLNFVRKVDEETKSTQKLKHLLILLCRLFAFVFLVLAFAQPYFQGENSAGKDGDEIIALYIDNSYSMQAMGSEGELLSEAREKAKDFIENTSVDARYIIGTNELSGADEHILNKLQALEKIDKISYSPLTSSIDRIINWQSEVVNKVKEDKTSIRYILISDFQKINEPIQFDFQLKGYSMYPIKLIPEANTNVYIDSVWFVSPINKPNVKKELFVRVVNEGKNELINLELNFSIGEMKKTIFMDIPENSTKETSITYEDKTTGLKMGVVKVYDEHIHFDDAFYFSYDVRKNANILIIDGEDSVPNVALVYDLDNYYVYEKHPFSSVTLNNFNNKDLVVLNGLNELSSGLSDYLKNFVKNGGSVAMFPGKKPNLSAWNNLLHSLSLPTLGEGVQSGTKIKSLIYKDPFFKGVFEKETKNLNLPGVSTIFRAIKANSNAVDLINLQNGLPLLSYSTLNGNAFMFYSSIHPDYGSIIENALFSTVLLRMGEISQRKQPMYMIIGEESKYPLFTEIKDDLPIHIHNETTDFIPQVNQNSGIRFITLNNLSNHNNLIAGNYTLTSGNKEVGGISLNFNRQESIPTFLSETEIKDILLKYNPANITYNEADNSGNLSTINLNKPFNYWKLCIIFTFIFVVAEMLLVRFLK